LERLREVDFSEMERATPGERSEPRANDLKKSISPKGEATKRSEAEFWKIA
jgi:hypothetical protein